MRVLVTGHRGYIGSVMTCILRQARFEVAGLDCDWYHGCDFGRVCETVPGFDTDLREIEFTDLLPFDAVVHLASLPEDAFELGHPQSGSTPNVARDDHSLIDEINHEATIRLAECAKQAHVSRFLFASSCAVYGRGVARPLDEQAPTNPLTAYASSKLRCEQELARLADRTFTPVFLRHGEVYGVSPRLRMDLTVADLVGSAVTQGRVTMKTGASGWRPVVHVGDLCRAYAAVLIAPDELVRNEVFNVVAPGVAPHATGENYRIIDIADMITDVLPMCTRSAAVDTFARQSFRADGSKLLRTFPKLTFRWTLPLGLRQLHTAMLSAGITPGDWRSDRYRRALRLQRLVEAGELNASLRRSQPAAWRGQACVRETPGTGQWRQSRSEADRIALL